MTCGGIKGKGQGVNNISALCQGLQLVKIRTKVVRLKRRRYMRRGAEHMDYGYTAIYLKNIYLLVNKDWFGNELPDVTVSVMAKAGTYGHFSMGKLWVTSMDQQHELNIAAGGLNRPIANVVATIVHEATHLYCYIKGIADTSNRGMYHNMHFKEEAEKRGLIIDKHPAYGWTLTTPSEALIIWCKENGLNDIDIYRTDYMTTTGKGNDSDGRVGVDGTNKGKSAGRKSSTRKYICESCHLTVRATRTVNILCGDCMRRMIKSELAG